MQQPLPSQPRARWRPSRRALWIGALAFGIGLVLFATVLWRDRNAEFYRVAPAAAPVPVEDEPLPAPRAAGDRLPGEDLGEAPVSDAPEPRPHIIEAPLPPAAPLPPLPSEPSPYPPTPSAGSGSPAPLHAPPPRYPPQALRRGESGTVLVRVHVGPDGVPTSVSLVQSSRSRWLDKAALDAVRDWRFRPAQINGRPTVGTVIVPIDFKPGR